MRQWVVALVAILAVCTGAAGKGQSSQPAPKAPAPKALASKPAGRSEPKAPAPKPSRGPRPALGSNKGILTPCSLWKRRRRTGLAPLPAEAGSVSVAWPIFACFAYFLSVALTAPAMPALCNSLANADSSTRVSAAGVTLMGTFQSVDQLMTFLFDPLWGAVSDHVGRKPLQLLACFGVTAGWGTVALSRSLPTLLLGRAVDGVTSCMLPMCQSAIKDITPPEQLVQKLGLLQGIAVGAAFIVGGVSGGVLSKLRGPREVFALAASTALVAGILIALFAPETLPKHRRAPRVAWGRANAMAAFAQLGQTRTSLCASAALLLFWLGLNGLQVNMYNYANFRFGWEPSTAVGLQAGSGVVLALSNVLGPQLLAPRIGDTGVIRFGMLLFAVCLLAMGLSSSGAGFALAVLSSSVATMCLPGLTGIIAQSAAPGQVGAMLTALDSVSTLDRLLAYKLMSKLFAWGIENEQPSVHFFAGSAFVLLGWLCFEYMVKAAAEVQASPLPVSPASVRRANAPSRK
ncbi:major facilitator superfamily domain-containing protein [Pavlovales sp. CCMP2436]|nr:major facilitator superfamily domain-containing protein [Pavlovales sp. CCMP2436]|mmetsp:Transcript_29572/g.74345  ORF Transcript_29572/g.74345 Transcript_29572/m.74345 type:complete len:517 (+) Transcript_29572:74-1624(+)